MLVVFCIYIHQSKSSHVLSPWLLLPGLKRTWNVPETPASSMLAKRICPWTHKLKSDHWHFIGSLYLNSSGKGGFTYLVFTSMPGEWRGRLVRSVVCSFEFFRVLFHFPSLLILHNRSSVPDSYSKGWQNVHDLFPRPELQIYLDGSLIAECKLSLSLSLLSLIHIWRCRRWP